MKVEVRFKKLIETDHGNTNLLVLENVKIASENNINSNFVLETYNHKTHSFERNNILSVRIEMEPIK